MAAEEAKRRIDMDKQKERLAKDKAAKEEQETTRKSQPKVVLESSDEEPSDDKPIPESDAGDDIEFSDDNGSNKSESEKESGDESVPNFLATSDEEEEEVKDQVKTDDDDDMEIDALVKKTSQKKKKPEEEEQVEPAKVEENAKKNIVDSDGEEKENLPKKKKTNKLLEGKITISSDSEEEPVPKAQTKKRGEKKKKSGKKRKRAELSSSGDDGHDEAASDDGDGDDVDEKQKKKKRKRKTDSDKENEEAEKAQKKAEKTKARNIMTDDKLSESTKQAELDEKERKTRLEKMREERKQTKKTDGFENAEWNGILNKEPLVQVDVDLLSKLKSHQVEGIQFMWDCVIESVTKLGKNDYKLGSNSAGHGAILAHCMGLGKTLQGITIAHTIISHEFMGLQRFVVLCPLNVCENWQIECQKWTANLDAPLESWNMHSSTDANERLEMAKTWAEQGGLLIMGYTMWRNLTTGKNASKKVKRLIPKFQDLLLKKPDVIICDEGHLLKNADSAVSKSVRQVKTLRRIVLTGTPMQNNLDEYHCMVDFVRPNLLGTSKEFRNRFANPIRNGESIDASAFDVKLMKKRAYLLSKQLDGVVQRKDYSYMCKHLPPKNEYVLSIKLSDVQAKLYAHYLNNESVALKEMSTSARTGKVSGRGLFSDFQTFLLVGNHPRCLLSQTENREDREEKKELDRFLVDGDDDDEESEKEFDESKLDDMDDKLPPPEPLNEDELKVVRVKCISEWTCKARRQST